MMINNVPPDQITAIIRDPKLTVVKSDTSRVMFVALRFQKAVIRDRRIREAINLAIDRKGLAIGILQGTATVADSPIAAPIFGRVSLSVPRHDPARAKALMQEANYSGEALELWVPNGRYLLDRQIGEAIGGYLKEVGFNVNLRVLEWGAFASEVFGPGKTWDMALYGWSLPNNDPDYLFDRLFHSNKTTALYKNELVDALAEEGKQAPDRQSAQEIYGKLQRLVWEDLPAIFLYYQPQIDAVNKNLKAYKPAFNERMIFVNTTLSQ
jgi:ABC-type transport system substrate-binding protein